MLCLLLTLPTHKYPNEVWHAGLLEQEVWAIVRGPTAIQLIVDTWLHQAAALKAVRTQPSPTSSRHSSRTASDFGKECLQPSCACCHTVCLDAVRLEEVLLGFILWYVVCQDA